MSARPANLKPALVPELLVSDFSASIAFYRDTLGFAVVYDRPEDPFAFIDLDGAQLMLDQHSPGMAREWVVAAAEHPYGRGINFEISVGDVQSLYEKCRTAGVRFFLDMEEKWYRRDTDELGVRQFIVLDPDGYMLRFSQSIGVRPANGKTQ